ncbi:hypothetical protein SAMN05892883_0586 [Jatrophihabitans sp. GAS493]|uniref:hypothetical protein n=1 Tax=Jatrophihabitans sp. GAS493 TaxID=1907575 RepID=UPI000BB903C3|nr:hypothetical protein [Jatrophihabitans sp. GAS493]SOD70973.1 hypothetical protein SAMN05892883_0586 [Jatrophihabitans sp. GAS493]
MPDFIEWCGFLGAWLLVAGALYQAVLELRDQDIRRDELIEASAKIPPPPPVSAWWWLLPPAHFWLTRQRREASRQQVMAQLPDEIMDGLIDFMNKARGWFIVGSGGFLIAIAETWDLTEKYEWNDWTFWAIVVVMASLCIFHSIYVVARSERARKHHHSKAA